MTCPQNKRRRFQASKSKINLSLFGPPQMGPIGWPETSVGNHHSTLRNIPDERSSHVRRGGSLISRTVLKISINPLHEATLTEVFRAFSSVVRQMPGYN